MSTKTTFKRIALVAVAALGLGVLSVAPSSATVSGLSVTVSSAGTAATGQSDSRTASTIQISGFLDNAKDTITVQFIADGARPTAVTGYTAGTPKLAYLETSTITTNVAKTSGTNYTSHQTDPTGDSVTVSTELRITPTAANATVGAKFTLQLDSITSATPLLYGTYNYLAVVKQYSYSLGDTLTMLTTTYPIHITVAKPAAVAAAEDTDPAAATSFSRLGSAAAPTQDGVDAVLTSVSTVGTVAGYLTVGVRNADGTDTAVAEDSVTATITGAGVLCETVSGICGKSFLLAAVGDQSFTIKADGTAGVATIATSTTTTTFASKTVTFYAKAAKTITAAVESPVLGIGDNADAISATAVDANGTAWTGTMYIVASAAADALVAGSATTPVACSYDTTDMVHYCSVTAIKAGTAKFKLIDASTVALATATSNEVTVTVSSARPAAIKVAFDKATYAPFEKAKITITPVDASGNMIAAVTGSALVTVAGITSTYAFSAGSDTLTAAGGITTSSSTGAKTYTVYMPAQGDVTISATGGTALAPANQGVAVTATATVVNSSVDAATDAANEATDAANAATDAALAAADAADAATAAAQDASDAVAALSTQVAALMASLKAQIKSLTNLVIKIQKKVKA